MPGAEPAGAYRKGEGPASRPGPRSVRSVGKTYVTSRWTISIATPLSTLVSSLASIS
jgi:hypothetical protein